LPPSRTTFIVAIPDSITLYRRWLCNFAADKFIVAGSYNFAADKFLFDSAMDGYAAIADHFVSTIASFAAISQDPFSLERMGARLSWRIASRPLWPAHGWLAG
jgi:hypothetical protein